MRRQVLGAAGRRAVDLAVRARGGLDIAVEIVDGEQLHGDAAGLRTRRRTLNQDQCGEQAGENERERQRRKGRRRCRNPGGGCRAVNAMYQLCYLEQAKNDLLQIKRYIARESGSKKSSNALKRKQKQANVRLAFTYSFSSER